MQLVPGSLRSESCRVRRSLEAQLIKSSAVGFPGGWQLPDLHFGYGPDRLASVLAAIGEDGRRKFLQLEAVDLLLYIPSYRAFFLVLVNRAAAFVKSAARVPRSLLQPLRLVSQLPFAVAAFDVAETVGQALLTLGFQSAGSSVWRVVAHVSGACNAAKWSLAALLAAGLLLLLFACVWISVMGTRHARRS